MHEILHPFASDGENAGLMLVMVRYIAIQKLTSEVGSNSLVPSSRPQLAAAWVVVDNLDGIRKRLEALKPR